MLIRIRMLNEQLTAIEGQDRTWHDRPGPTYAREVVPACVHEVVRGHHLAPRDRVLALLPFYAGLCIAEAVGLDVDDVRFSVRKGTLRVHGKGATLRELPIHPPLRTDLQFSSRLLQDYPAYPTCSFRRAPHRCCGATVAECQWVPTGDVSDRRVRRRRCYLSSVWILERARTPIIPARWAFPLSRHDQHTTFILRWIQA